MYLVVKIPATALTEKKLREILFAVANNLHHYPIEELKKYVVILKDENGRKLCEFGFLN